jgi:hypothetical protein
MLLNCLAACWWLVFVLVDGPPRVAELIGAGSQGCPWLIDYRLFFRAGGLGAVTVVFFWSMDYHMFPCCLAQDDGQPLSFVDKLLDFRCLQCNEASVSLVVVALNYLVVGFTGSVGISGG